MRTPRVALALALAMVGTGAVAATAQAQGSPAPARQSMTARAAIPGYQVVTLPNLNVPNFQRRTVFCPAGKVAIGGGAEAQGPNAVLVGSFPSGNNGWIGLGRQIGAGDVGISVYVICANLS
ncbi:hypothetical protein [Bailinhaonella thermotolerans]|uniref:Uncharacterized protein n=1 Tax=Bailinhaonella thermotolerans TaxID=1070861 RepID=A0A3A4B2Z1_9ACTN|nr:hypothetical protein [Bailinhaonella thermotolerans]RJL36085.1 hypothetical protein D5H75_04845 [Bailinhaonella thermotolerans]